MEETSPVKLSVAELAGKFKSHPLPMPRNDERKPVRRSPPCSLQLHDQMENESEKEKLNITPQPPPKAKLRNSPLIEKLQASPILLPNILLSTARSPEGKQQIAPFCPFSPCSPQSSTLRSPQQHNINEVPVSFEQPAEGTILPNFNKSRVRPSFKRRPPTRQHRISTGEEGAPETPEENRTPCDPHSPDGTPEKNDNIKDALNVPQEETYERQEDASPPITVQETEMQEQQDDVTKDNDEDADAEGDTEEEIEEKSVGNTESSGAVDNSQEEKAIEEQNTEETVGAKEERSTDANMEEENQNQDQVSGD